MGNREDGPVTAAVEREIRGTRPGEPWGRSGEVSGTVRIVTGVLPSGVPYRTEVFTPDRTPEEAAAWERRVSAACREFVGAYIRKNGFEAAKEKLEAKT